MFNNIKNKTKDALEKAKVIGDDLKGKYDKAKDNESFDKINSAATDKAKDFIEEQVLNRVSNTKSFRFINVLEAEKKFYLVIAIALAITTSILSYVVYDLSAKSRTIVLPPQVSKEFWITDRNLSETYFEQVSYYIADRVLSVNPESVKYAYEALLPFFGSDGNEIRNIKRKLEDQSKFIQKENIYQTFYPNYMQANYEKKRIVVIGQHRKYVGELFVQELKNASITIDYDIQKGKFIIKNLIFNIKDVEETK